MKTLGWLAVGVLGASLLAGCATSTKEAPLASADAASSSSQASSGAAALRDWRSEQPRVFIARASHYRQGTSDEAMREIRDAGFNVFGHRWASVQPGRLDLADIEAHVALCERYGLGYMPWMRGSVIAPPDDPHLRMVWGNGQSQPIHGPLSPVLWEYLESTLLRLAQMSRTRPVVGVLLDFENYYPNKQANLWHRSYDHHSLTLFARERGLLLPPATMTPGQGPAWLADQGLTQVYDDWHEAEFARRTVDLRRRIDALNPRFAVGVYSGEGMVERFKAGMATTDAPVWITASSTYGRPSPLLTEAQSLQATYEVMLQGMAVARRMDHPFLLLGGVMPSYMGADPSFNAKSLVTISALADGYWVWFETQKHGTADWRDHFRWMTIANRELDRGRHSLRLEPRLEHEARPLKPTIHHPDRVQVGLYGQRKDNLARTLDDPRFELHVIGSLHAEYLKHLDVVILQNLNVAANEGSDLHRQLRAYVEQGGSLLLAHDTGWFVHNLFPDVAVRGYPTQRVSHLRHVLDTRLAIARTLPATADAPALPIDWQGRTFETGFVDHAIFEPGPAGHVLAVNAYDEAVYIAGRHGQGRVVFTGCYFAYQDALPAGMERDLLWACMDWLIAGGASGQDADGRPE